MLWLTKIGKEKIGKTLQKMRIIIIIKGGFVGLLHVVPMDTASPETERPAVKNLRARRGVLVSGIKALEHL